MELPASKRREPRIASVLDVNGEGEDAIYCTSDMKIVASLLANRVEVNSLDVEESGRVVFYFERSSVADGIISSWLTNKPIPIEDIRVIFEAISNFHAIVRQARQAKEKGASFGEKARASDTNAI